MRKISLSLAPLLVALAAGPVLAQEEADPDHLGAPPKRVVGPIPKREYDTTLTHRPLTLPTGTFELRAGYELLRVEFCLFSCETLTAGFLDVDARFGILDRFEMGLSTSMQLHEDFEYSEIITVSARALAVDTPAADLALTLDVPLNFSSDEDLIDLLFLDANLRLLIGDKFFVWTGRPSHTIPSLAFFSPWSLPLVTIGLGDDDTTVLMTLNGGVGVQATPNLGLTFGTTVAVFSLSPESDAAFIGADFLPLTLGATYGVDAGLDISAGVSFIDLKEDAGWLVFSVGLSKRL
jgi:hypothetical protein